MRLLPAQEELCSVEFDRRVWQRDFSLSLSKISFLTSELVLYVQKQDAAIVYAEVPLRRGRVSFLITHENITSI